MGKTTNKQTKKGVAALRTPGRQSQAGLWGLLTTPPSLLGKCQERKSVSKEEGEQQLQVFPGKHTSTHVPTHSWGHTLIPKTTG